jgi:murein DD-endopeptidase MepM/ murein hydrolase activator NlpD
VELAEQADEGDPAAEVSTAAPAPPRTGARASLGRMAARVGSLFRPKSDESQMRPRDVDLTELVSADFLIPVEGVDAEKLRDSFLASRGRFAKHLAIDIGAPRGTPILATTDGEIVRTAKEKRGGNSIYQKDATGQYLLFYCHLSRYAADMVAGRKVKKGEVIGYVGSTGHVIGGPHLHFSITRVPEDVDDFRKGLAINPYLIFLAGGP